VTHRLIQIHTETNERLVCLADDQGMALAINGVTTTYELARLAIANHQSLSEAIKQLGTGDKVDITLAIAQGRVLTPVDHPDPAHLYLTGTGLTHLGSAEGRDQMHKNTVATKDQMTDSMRMFVDGVEGGKPTIGTVGAQPEWFYKGNGHNLVASGQSLKSPSFALDGGEEPEIAGIYVIGEDRKAYRLGFCLGNEFSDHITEKRNYLLLAHSKLRPGALGVELLTGALPEDVRGISRIVRDNEIVWQKPFVSGEANMSHTIANLEHHHFKYDLFRQPGDIHVHFFGTATASFADGFETMAGDLFEIEAAPFFYPLRNTLSTDLKVYEAVTAL
jgi:hypothetical protein